MEPNRAKEIIDADVFVNVTYHGIPVYLQAVQEDVAKIFPLDAMNHVQEVDIEGLSETGPIIL
ncbi:H-type small acid-soluble spore protein [Ornithinibacillus contaminans]|uniref:H-type small acid-soluble spore protein n=1 Tax=Ornithinibacillus contaminans TaxID=694055 RepID=UPI00064D9072|nr:H-type small acid-soluble spore protein [Ornithinibacillus contaminans]